MKRVLKVQGRYRVKGSPSSYLNRRFQVVPQILLIGNWIKASGFKEHSKVSVSIEPEKLIVEPIKF